MAKEVSMHSEDGGTASRADVEKARRWVLDTFHRQAEVLQEVRRQHSHSDVLTPPDLAMDHLSPATKQLKSALDEVLTEQSFDSKDRLRDVIQRDLMSFEARRFVYSALQEDEDATQQGRTMVVESFKALFDHLDVILSLEMDEVVDPGLPLTIHEEVMERLPIESCALHFDYIESRIDQLTRGLVPSKGKGLIFLRICNELIRRLSKPTRQHTIFAGRVLTLLSSVLPFGERSGVNFRSDFNTDNKTVLDDLPPDELDAEEETSVHAEGQTPSKADDEEERQSVKMTKEERKAAELKAQREGDEKLAQAAHNSRFYSMFWTMQKWFASPTSLFEDSFEDDQTAPLPQNAVDPASEGTDKKPFRFFRISTSYILKVFAAVGRIEKELAGGTSIGSGRKRSDVEERTASAAEPLMAAPIAAGADLDVKSIKRRKLVNGSNQTADESGDGDAGESFFPKYLTGRNLFEYELRDVTFRRHILVQFLILFQYLLSFTQKYREQMELWKNKSLVNLLKGVAFTLEDADERWIRDAWREVTGLLSAIPVDGRTYADTVSLILRRETNWLRWKSDDCPPIDCPPMSEEQIAAFTRARKPILQPLRPYPHAVGTAALSKLWEDGVRKPEPRTRVIEDAEGMEVEVQTDGLDDLEMGPMIPSFESYASKIEQLERRALKRREELGWDTARPYVIGGSQTTADMRKKESERMTREEKDATLSQWEQQRSVLAWRAMRMARTTYLDRFAKMRCELEDGATTIGVRVDDVSRLVKAVSDKENGIPALPTAAPTPPPSAGVDIPQMEIVGEQETDQAMADDDEEKVEEAEGVGDEEDANKREGREDKAEENGKEKDAELTGEEADAEREGSPEYEPHDSVSANEDAVTSPTETKVKGDEMAVDEETSGK